VYERSNLAVKLITINLIGYPIQFRVGQEKDKLEQGKGYFYIVKMFLASIYRQRAHKSMGGTTMRLRPGGLFDGAPP
jgi:hypothetical protein